nr:MAG TPA: Signal recognition particle 14kD protein [Bacteriophage sp.]
MRGVEPLSYIFASKHSYSIGFKDYPCLFRADRIDILSTSTTLFLKYTENL